MPAEINIKYLQQPEIDKNKWDRCIERASNGLIYGYSVYLDKMATHWDALVMNDYEAVMPLTWNRKYGIAYLHQPFLCAQLGVFGNTITEKLFTSFLHAIPKKFKYWDIYLNHQNLFATDEFRVYERSNYVLSLARPYDDLYSQYRENIRRNIKKATQLGCKAVKDFDVQQVIELAVAQMQNFSKKSKENVERFKGLYKTLHRQKQAITYGIESSQNRLLASCVFFYSHDRAYYILVGNHPDGRTLGASHALIDAFIKDHAGKNLVLDFEGSDIRNLAFFYSSFGAVGEKFGAVKLNRLPFFLKWMKD